MNKRIQELIKKDVNTGQLTHEEYEEIQKSLEGTGLEYQFSHKKMCELCKYKPPIVESIKTD